MTDAIKPVELLPDFDLTQHLRAIPDGRITKLTGLPKPPLTQRILDLELSGECTGLPKGTHKCSYMWLFDGVGDDKQLETTIRVTGSSFKVKVRLDALDLKLFGTFKLGIKLVPAILACPAFTVPAEDGETFDNTLEATPSKTAGLKIGSLVTFDLVAKGSWAKANVRLELYEDDAGAGEVTARRGYTLLPLEWPSKKHGETRSWRVGCSALEGDSPGDFTYCDDDEQGGYEFGELLSISFEEDEWLPGPAKASRFKDIPAPEMTKFTVEPKASTSWKAKVERGLNTVARDDDEQIDTTDYHAVATFSGFEDGLEVPFTLSAWTRDADGEVQQISEPRRVVLEDGQVEAKIVDWTELLGEGALERNVLFAGIRCEAIDNTQWTLDSVIEHADDYQTFAPGDVSDPKWANAVLTSYDGAIRRVQRQAGDDLETVALALLLWTDARATDPAVREQEMLHIGGIVLNRKATRLYGAKTIAVVLHQKYQGLESSLNEKDNPERKKLEEARKATPKEKQTDILLEHMKSKPRWGEAVKVARKLLSDATANPWTDNTVRHYCPAGAQPKWAPKPGSPKELEVDGLTRFRWFKGVG